MRKEDVHYSDACLLSKASIKKKKSLSGIDNIVEMPESWISTTHHEYNARSV